MNIMDKELNLTEIERQVRRENGLASKEASMISQSDPTRSRSGQDNLAVANVPTFRPV